MFLNWITQAVKQAIIKGFQEAAEELELATDEGPAALDTLKARMKPVAIADESNKPRRSVKAAS